MNNQEHEKPEFGVIVRVVLLSFLVIVLPATAWSLFAWMHLLLPLMAFYILNRFGGYTGRRFLITSATLAALAFMLLKSIDLLLLSSILLGAGYILFSSAAKNDSPVMSGLKASATIGAGWYFIFMFFPFGEDVSLYEQLLITLDEGIVETLKLYRESDSVTPDNLIMLETMLYQMKALTPLIMPAILGGIILLVTWFTMVLGNSLVVRFNGSSPWIEYENWQLPEKLIWLGIILALASFIPLRIVKLCGINGLILLSIIYCFQGLAIAVFFMNKWNVPILLRSFFYVMMIVQSFGTILLLVLGVSDIWFDYRKLRQEAVDDQE